MRGEKRTTEIGRDFSRGPLKKEKFKLSCWIKNRFTFCNKISGTSTNGDCHVELWKCASNEEEDVVAVVVDAAVIAIDVVVVDVVVAVVVVVAFVVDAVVVDVIFVFVAAVGVVAINTVDVDAVVAVAVMIERLRVGIFYSLYVFKNCLF